MSKKSEESGHRIPEEALKNNPKVSKSVVAEYRELEKKLEKLGVDTKPHYTLSPPLGGAISSSLKKTS